MALTHQRVSEQGRAAYLLCNEAAALLARIKYFLASNSDLAIDWAAVTKPDYITEDAAGNLEGLPFSRNQVANAVFSLDQIRLVLENGEITVGDHLGNINQLAAGTLTR